MLELPPNTEINNSDIDNCLKNILITYPQKVEFSLYIHDDVIDNCIDGSQCLNLDNLIHKSISNKYVNNISFDKKLNDWYKLQNYKKLINFNSWSYYAENIDEDIMIHKRIIYKNKEVNQEK